MNDHAAIRMRSWDDRKKTLVVDFRHGTRLINLGPLFKNHPALRNAKNIPVLENGGIKIGVVSISGPTAFHMGIPFFDDRANKEIANGLL